MKYLSTFFVIFFFLLLFKVSETVVQAQTCMPNRVINQYACVNPVQVCSAWVQRCQLSPGTACSSPADCPGASACILMCNSWNPSGPPTCQTTGSQNVACNPAPACNFTGGIQQCGMTGGGSSASCYERSETLSYGCWTSGGGGSAGGGGGGGGGGWGACGSCSCAGIGIGVDPACRNSPAGCVWDPGGCGGGSPVPESCFIYGAPGYSDQYNIQVGETVVYAAEAVPPSVPVGGRGTFRGASRQISVPGGGPANVSVIPVAHVNPRPYPFYITGTAPGTSLIRFNVQMSDSSGNPVDTCFKYIPVTVSACTVPGPPTGLAPANIMVNPGGLCNASCSSDIDCDSHIVEARFSRNGATFTNSGANYNQYRYLYFDRFVEEGLSYNNSDPRVLYSNLKPTPTWLTLTPAAGYYGNDVRYTDDEGVYFRIPTIFPSLTLWMAKGTTTGFADLFVDGKPYGSRINLNAVDVPPITAPIQLPPINTGGVKSFACTAGACRRKDNPSDNTCAFNANLHRVTLVNKPVGAQNYFWFDAIEEDGVRTENTSPRIVYGPSWSLSAGATYSGGSSRINTSGRQVTFTTTASNLSLVTTRSPQAANFDVYVDGALTQNIVATNPTVQYQAVIPINLPPKPQSNSSAEYVDLTWNDTGYGRYDIEVYPQGSNCSNASAYCGRISQNRYRFIPNPAVSAWSFRVRSVNEECLSMDLKVGAWSALTNFTTDNTSIVTSTVQEDLGGNATLVGGVCQLASGVTPYTGGGTVTVSKPGFTGTSPVTGGAYTVPAVPGGPGYNISLVPSNASYACTCPTGCTYTNVTVPTAAGGRPFFISPVAASWFQTIGADIAALNPGVGASVTNPIPRTFCTTTGCSPYLTIPLVTGNPSTAGALVVSNSSTVDLDANAGNQTSNVGNPSHLVRQTNPQVCRENYDYFYRIYSMGINPTPDDFGNQTNATLPATDTPGGTKTAFYDGGPNLTIANPWTLGANRRLVIFVNGNLNINANITVPTTSFLAFIVKGNITIGSTVGTTTYNQTTNGQVQGVYVADGTLTVATVGVASPTAERKFVGEGVFAACGGIVLPRDFRNGASGANGIENNSNPATLFRYRPDLVNNTPPRMKTSLVSWEEVAP